MSTPAANAFDDIPTTVPGLTESDGNAFDDLKPPAPKPKDKAEERPPSLGSQVVHLGGMAGRAVTNAVAALPFMAMDAGVGARNLFGKVTGIGGTDYEYPSQTLRQAEDQYFGTPQNAAEKLEDIVAPIAVGGASAAARAVPSASPVTNALAAGLRNTAGASPVTGTTLGGAGGAPSELAILTPAQLRSQRLAQVLKDSQNAGYVVPPATSNPTVKNVALETVAGKIATQQAAALANQSVTNRLAAQAVGLSPDVPLTPQALAAVRAEAGKAYGAMRNLGRIMPDDEFRAALEEVRSSLTGVENDFPGSAPSPLVKEINNLAGATKPGRMDPTTLNQAPPAFSAANAVTKIKDLRDAADVAGRAGNKGLAMGYKKLADATEAQIDRAAQARLDAGDTSIDPNVVTNFRNARQTIAKTYSIENALNEATGDVSAIKLANSGDPLSGELATAANFGSAFPKAAQDAAKIGSAGVSHLGTYGALGTGALAEHLTGSPYAIAAGAALPLARAGAKAYLLGPGQVGAIPKVVGPGSPKSAAAIAQALKTFSP